MLTCAQSIRMSESLSRRRIWPLMCYAFKWSFTAAYLFLLVMGTVGFLRDFSAHNVVTMSVDLVLASFGKIDGLWLRSSPCKMTACAHISRGVSRLFVQNSARQAGELR